MVRSKSDVEIDMSPRVLKADAETLSMFPPYPALRRPRLKFDPQGFVIENERLEQKVVEGSVQWRSLNAWEANPKRAMNYIVCGNPDDEKAMYFAAYLASVHRKRLGINSDIVWEP